MRVQDITKKINIYDKPGISLLFETYQNITALTCKTLTCIDLQNLDDLKKELDIVGKSSLLIYVFQNLDTKELQFVGLPLLYGQSVNSFKSIWPSLDVYERKVSHNFGIKFYTTERVQKEITEKSSPSYMEKNYTGEYTASEFLDSYSTIFETEKTTLNFKELGLAPMEGALEVIFDGDNCKDILPKISSSLGLEKMFESHSLEHISNLISHINIRNWIPYQLLWSETVDFINDREIDFYEQLKRMLFLEISRVLECSDSLRNTFKVIEEEKLSTYFFSLHRHLSLLLLTNESRTPFPVLIDPQKATAIDEAWKRSLLRFVKESVKTVEDLENSVVGIQSIFDKTNFSDKSLDPIGHGLSGVALAGEGINFQTRKEYNFYCYEELELESFLGMNGATYDRLIIRINEIVQSLSNIVRIVESFPIFTEKEEIKNVLHRTDKIIFSHTECSHGDLSYVLALSKNNSIERLAVSTPTMQMLPYYLNSFDKLSFERVLHTWTSLGLSLEEVVL
jgi:NADH:ubiquinone oxidoreductase subunit D/NADH:ubiquinone oxidoreductase subunit C